MKVRHMVTFVVLGFLGTQTLAANTDSLPEERRGVVIGSLIGASVGGPIGAGAGAIIGGALIGKTMGVHRVNAELSEAVNQIAAMSERNETELKARIASLNRSLSEARSVEVVAKASPELPIQFKTDSSNIESHYKDRLAEIAGIVATSADARVILSGFADRRGEESYNQQLSELRVKEVKDFLVAHGVAANRIDTRAFGETRPVNDEDSPESFFFDRRVVMEFSVDSNESPVASR
ncbi:MAG: sortase-associated OmpA-like protein PdsO [Pseudomonadales bacterium]